MILSDGEIHKYIEEGELVIVGTQDKYPFNSIEQVQPCSIDLRLGNRFLKFKKEISLFDIKNLNDVWSYIETFEYKDGEKIVLAPHEIIFGEIYEQLRIPSDVSGRIEGRSRFARLGISIHSTGGFINPEFEGAMPLQLINNNNIPIVIYPFMSVCQLILTKLTSPPLVAYPKRSNNPYHKEVHAGPSISNIDPAISSKCQPKSLQSEIEKRLVIKYLEDKKSERLIGKILSSSPKSGDITINNSTFGVFNAGITGDIESTLRIVKNDVSKVQVADLIEEITRVINENSKKLSADLKNETLELIKELTKQLSLDKEKRSSPSIIKTIVDKIGSVFKGLVSNMEVWIKIYEVISKYFGF